MGIAPAELIGCSVLEVGNREGVPYLTFGAGARAGDEVRLVIETSFEVDGLDDGSHMRPLRALMSLSVRVAETSEGRLQIDFDGGVTLNLEAERAEWTEVAPWWLTDWYPRPDWGVDWPQVS